jgi:hypothetical protein
MSNIVTLIFFFWNLKFRSKILWAILTAKLIKELSDICGLTRSVNLSRNRTWRRWISLRRMWDRNTECPWQRCLQLGTAKLPRKSRTWNIHILRTQVRGVINRILNVAKKKNFNRRIVGKVIVDVRFFHHVWLTGVVKLQVKLYLLKKYSSERNTYEHRSGKGTFHTQELFCFSETDVYSDIELRCIKVRWAKNHTILDSLDLATSQG